MDLIDRENLISDDHSQNMITKRVYNIGLVNFDRVDNLIVALRSIGDLSKFAFLIDCRSIDKIAVIDLFSFPFLSWRAGNQLEMRLFLYHFLSLTFYVKMKGVVEEKRRTPTRVHGFVQSQRGVLRWSHEGRSIFFAFRKRKINGVIGTGGDDVEFRIEHVDAMHDSVKPWKREGGVAIVQPHLVLAEIKKFINRKNI